MNKRKILWSCLLLILLTLFFFCMQACHAKIWPFVKQGFTEADGNYYYYNEDGSLFTDGYKKLTVNGTSKAYFFQEDGSAFTGGYKEITADGVTKAYFFQEDGSAFTDGYKQITVDGITKAYFFQSNGSAFTGGYKQITVGGITKVYFFQEDGSAFTGGYKEVTVGSVTKAYFFQEDGSAFTDGYKEVTADGVTKAYFFQEDGSAFTGGYKEITVGGITKAYFFQEDGSAFTGGQKEITLEDTTCYYYFQEDGSALTDSWQTVGDAVQYFDTNGQAVRSSFLTIGDSLYYFDDACVLVADCWFCVEDGYYYADENGIIATDTVVEGYKLDATGKSSTKYRIIQLVNEHTDPAMTEQEKIEALYNWILTGDMGYIRTYEHVKSGWVWKDSWVDDMAASQMDNWAGNCFRYAAFLGMLIREATGLPVTVYHGQTPGIAVPLTPHGWPAVLQDGTWYIYDVELEKFTGYKHSGCYKVPASESRMHRQGVGTDLFS